jgi:hypothetical protein
MPTTKKFRNKISTLLRHTGAAIPPAIIPEPLNAEFESLDAAIRAVKPSLHKESLTLFLMLIEHDIFLLAVIPAASLVL